MSENIRIDIVPLTKNEQNIILDLAGDYLYDIVNNKHRLFNSLQNQTFFTQDDLAEDLSKITREISFLHPTTTRQQLKRMCGSEAKTIASLTNCIADKTNTQIIPFSVKSLLEDTIVERRESAKRIEV